MGVTIFGELRREVKFKGSRKQNCVELIENSTYVLWLNLQYLIRREAKYDCNEPNKPESSQRFTGTFFFFLFKSPGALKINMHFLVGKLI